MHNCRDMSAAFNACILRAQLSSACSEHMAHAQGGAEGLALRQQFSDLREQFTAWSDSEATQARLRALEGARGLASEGAAQAFDAETAVGQLRAQARIPCCG